MAENAGGIVSSALAQVKLMGLMSAKENPRTVHCLRCAETKGLQLVPLCAEHRAERDALRAALKWVTESVWFDQFPPNARYDIKAALNE